MRRLRASGVRLTAYLDDVLVLGRTPEECARHGQLLVDLLHDLGFRFSTEKCSPVPSRKFRFLGWDVDTTSFVLSLPDAKRDRIRRECRRILRWDQRGEALSVRTLSRLLGQLAATADAVRTQRVKSHALERCRALALRQSGAQWDSPCSLSEDARKELRWWERQVAHLHGRPIRLPPVDVLIRTDASALGWGVAVMDSRVPQFRGIALSGRLPTHLRESVSNETELFAIHRALLAMSTRGDMRGLHVRVQSDNSTAVFYVNRGAGRALRMTQAAVALWRDLDRWGLTLSAEYLPGSENEAADALSRRPLSSDDWVLRWQAFNTLKQRFGTLTVDAFADEDNTRLRRFASVTPHPKAVGVSGLLLDYRVERAYCFPPPRLVPNLLTVLLERRASAVVVVPHRPGAPWWPLWLRGAQESLELNAAVLPYLRRPRTFVSPRLMAGRFCGSWASASG